MIKFISLDPALNNTGWAIGYKKQGVLIFKEGGVITPSRYTLPYPKETVYRVRELERSLKHVRDSWKPEVVYVEIPIGSQSANAAWSLATSQAIVNVVFGDVDRFFVTPRDAKLYSGFNKKRDIIKWAQEVAPDLIWTDTLKDSHMADAVMIALAINHYLKTNPKKIFRVEGEK